MKIDDVGNKERLQWLQTSQTIFGQLKSCVSSNLHRYIEYRKSASNLLNNLIHFKLKSLNQGHYPLFYHPVYAIEYFWKDKNKKKVVEFDALTGEAKFEYGAIKKQVTKVLENSTFFDFSADAAGTLIPGANLVVKLGRIAANKLII